MMKRTFIALKIKLNDRLSRVVEQLKKELWREQIRWVDEQNLHLTLKFLGDTSPQQIEKVKEVLAELTGKYDPFSFRLGQIGYFKHGGTPSVLFLRISESETMNALAGLINVKLEDLGFEVEPKAFKPHLTVARIKHLGDKTHFYKALEKCETDDEQVVTVKEIIFYESILKRTGPQYVTIQKFKLG